ncbi:MAG: hypothetical protein HFI67_12060 [Lachnospiraceae bacterium]|jgi:hypothetical protein|nr:hypothetical protein [Lachnospiraceae bacterium]
MYGMTIKKVKTGEENPLSDWGLALENAMPQETPEVKTYRIDVPGAHGILDLSEGLWGLRFENRKLPFVLGGLREKKRWPSVYSAFLNAYHGQQVEITLDIDPNWCYKGRFYVKGSLARTARIGKMECELDADPFKYGKQSSLEPWKWDSFSFVNGVIRNYGNIEVNGSLEFPVIGGEHNVTPAFLLLSGTVNVSFRGITHEMVNGRNTFYDFDLEPGRNLFSFTGSGRVAIDFKEVSL